MSECRVNPVLGMGLVSAAIVAAAGLVAFAPGCKVQGGNAAPIVEASSEAAPMPGEASEPATSVVFNGGRVVVPEGSIVDLEIEGIEVGAQSSTQQRATGVGAGLETSSPEGAAGFEASAPGATLPGVSATGGSSAFDGTWKIGGQAVNAFALAAIAALIGAAWLAYRRAMRPALVAGVLGVAFAALAVYPGATLLVAGLAAAVCVALYIRAAGKGEAVNEALRAVVAGVEDLPEGERQRVKGKVASHATEEDRATIREVKIADGYGGERSR